MCIRDSNDILRDNAAVQKLFHSDIMQNKLIQQSLQILKESLKLRDILQEAKELTQMKHYLLQQDSGNDGFDLSGFFYFQCKDLKELAQKAFEQVFAAYLEEMEYRQVVCALQEFMQQQRPIVEVLHVIPQEDGSFCLLYTSRCV